MIKDWKNILDENINDLKTPCYIFCPDYIKESLEYISNIDSPIPIINWLSVKTQPVKQLLQFWKKIGGCVEVVSYYEFLAVMKEGFPINNILINGVAKHEWLTHIPNNGLRVHFDSFSEIHSLSKIAKKYNWKIGLRIKVNVECDPDDRKFKGQFGFMPYDIELAIEHLRKNELSIESIHFHINSDMSDVKKYSEAIDEIADLTKKYDLNIKYLDCGGGLPSYFINNKKYTSHNGFNFYHYSKVIKEIQSKIPSIEEVWLENGRFMTSRAAILLIKVIDIKEQDDCRYIICDGGRTNHAMVSDWEIHKIECYPNKYDNLKLSTICGPTCMAYDHLTRTELPNDIQIGDYLIWYDAGAYHIPWETRFSNGYANVYWYENNNLKLIRESESFENWWNQWTIK